MKKNVMLSEEAYDALLGQKENNESFSDAVKRLAPAPIRTFGDLERHLEKIEGPLNLGFKALERIRMRKLEANRLH
jgi:predicted CopG family antitoxin